MYDDDFGDEMEAIHSERLDADLEMAMWEREGNAYWAQVAVFEKTGDPDDCPHGSEFAYRNPPMRPEQVGLKPGEWRCDRCESVLLDGP